MAERPAALRARRAFRQSSLVDERSKYFLAALLELRGVHPYHLRRSGRRVWRRHPGDSWTLEEIFGARTYDLPPPIRAMLEARPGVLVGDLGANVGLFGAYILDVLPQARLVGYEPDQAMRPSAIGVSPGTSGLAAIGSSRPRPAPARALSGSRRGSAGVPGSPNRTLRPR